MNKKNKLKKLKKDLVFFLLKKNFFKEKLSEVVVSFNILNLKLILIFKYFVIFL